LVQLVFVRKAHLQIVAVHYDSVAMHQVAAGWCDIKALGSPGKRNCNIYPIDFPFHWTIVLDIGMYLGPALAFALIRLQLGNIEPKLVGDLLKPTVQSGIVENFWRQLLYSLLRGSHR
jgi:hypothetical protein